MCRPSRHPDSDLVQIKKGNIDESNEPVLSIGSFIRVGLISGPFGFIRAHHVYISERLAPSAVNCTECSY